MTFYSRFDSSAINSIETKENQVFVTYNSNIAKEYVYNCENIADFSNNLCEVLTGVELNNKESSLGRFISNSRKSGVLTDVEAWQFKINNVN